MSSWGICSSRVTSCAEIEFQQPHCPHRSELALSAFLSGFIAAQSCWERQSRDTSGKKLKINSSHTSHMNSFFSKEEKNCLTSEEKLQIVNFRSLPSRVPLSCPRLKRRRESAGQLRCDHSFSFCYREVMGRPSQDRWFVCALVSQRTHTLAKQNHYQQ